MASQHYTVSQLAKLSGVSVRTLRHYDQMGLVVPRRGENNYRLYGPDELDRLQQVLLYREADMALADIRRVLDDPAFDVGKALSEHLRELFFRRDHIEKLIASVEKTLAAMKGTKPMNDEEKFEGFKKDIVDENERVYGAEIRGRWGDGAIDASNAKVLGMGEDRYRAVKDLEKRVKEALLSGIEEGDPSGPEAQRAVDLHRQWLCAFWEKGAYSKEAHCGMAEMYVADPRFKAYYDDVAPGAAEFLRDAVRVYCS